MSKTTGCRTCDGSGEVYAGIEALLADCPDCTTPAPDHAQARGDVLAEFMDRPDAFSAMADEIVRLRALAASPQEGREAGVADALIACTRGAQNEWQYITRAVAPHLDGKMSPEEFCEMLMAYGVACYRATPPVAPLPPVVTPPTDDEALDLWRAVKRNQVDEADAVVMFTRLLTAALAERPRG